MTTERRIDRVVKPEYVADLSEISLDDLRTKRDECQEIETEVSYVRRLAQARMEILRAELDRRARGGSLEELIAQLPTILGGAPGESTRTRPVDSRLPRHLAPSVDIEWSRGYEHLIADDTLANLPLLPDAELESTIVELKAFERDASQSRRALHDVIDRLEIEIGARHKVS
jgi:hypothetical protein